MDAKAFFANIAPTIFFAFVGTFLSTFVVGGMVYFGSGYSILGTTPGNVLLAFEVEPETKSAGGK